jgi:threonine synthase
MSYITGLRCLRCGAEYPVSRMFDGCPKHTGALVANLTPTYDYDAIGKVFSREALASRPPSMWRYREFLAPDEADIVTMGEGFTPLVPCTTLGREVGLKHLYVKDESRNATWSFKDRMASAGISMARRFGASVVTGSSSGNAGSATAAYAARAGLDCLLFTTQQFPLAMKVQMQVYGTKLIACPTIEDRWRMVRMGVDQLGWYPIPGYGMPPIGSNPYGVDGYKTIGFEIVEQLGWRAPDVVVVPVGAGDAFYGTWKAFQEWYRLGYIDKLPRMIAAEVFGPVAAALAQGLDYVPAVKYHPTVGISVGTYQSTFQALTAVRESGGCALEASDDEMIDMQKTLAAREGMYNEMSSVLSLAVTKKLAADGVIGEDEVVVALLTSAGIKDPEVTALHMPALPLIQPNMDSLAEALRNTYGYTL